MIKIQDETVESILGTVPGTVFRSDETGEVIIVTGGNYAISVCPEGHTHSAYLVTADPYAIAQAMDADEAEISGWATGWEA
jgi:hypothetical protein